jgi:hypothetical protein
LYESAEALDALGVERFAGRVTHPLGTPGARQSGAAVASVEAWAVIKATATAADTGKATSNSKRISGTFDMGTAPTGRRQGNTADDRADFVWRHQVFP